MESISTQDFTLKYRCETNLHLFGVSGPIHFSLLIVFHCKKLTAFLFSTVLQSRNYSPSLCFLFQSILHAVANKTGPS